MPAPTSPDVATRYIELLKEAVMGGPCLEAEAAYYLSVDGAPEIAGDGSFDVGSVAPHLVDLIREARATGRFVQSNPARPGFGMTMVGRTRLDELAACVEDALARDVPGDLVECGVWRGGAAMLMRGVLAAHDVSERTVWVCDSFAGLPDVTSGHDPQGATETYRPMLAVSRARVAEHFDRLGLLDDQVQFVEGWFADTLPGLPATQIAVLRLDGDYYTSTTDALEALYDRVSPGGFVIIDDYGLPYCRLAVDKFRARRGIDAPLTQVDWTGMHWRKAG